MDLFKLWGMIFFSKQLKGVFVMGLSRIGPMLFVACSLSGCFGAKDEPPPVPPPLPPTKVELHIQAASDANPNLEGRGSPVLLRIYELKGLAAFNAADYFALNEKDQAALGADLARKQEFMLRPGEKKNLLLQPEDSAGFFAAFAGFRSLGSARWRVSAPIPLHATSVLVLKLTGSKMELSSPLPQQTGQPESPQSPQPPNK